MGFLLFSKVSMRISDFQRYHFIGIKGAGMTALAELYLGLGREVTGSDTSEVFYTDKILKRLKIRVQSPFSSKNIPKDAEAFIYSTAYTRETNEELAVALDSGRPALSYPEALGALSKERMTLAVCGTHGKTTTSALLAETFKEAGVDPSAIIGSEPRNWKGSALVGKGHWLIIEADEYQNKLSHYHPFGAILTSVDFDHPDYFPAVNDYEQVFSDFLHRIPHHGFAVVCGDQARAEFLSRDIKARRYTYGFHISNDIRAINTKLLPESEREKGMLQEFSVLFGDRSLGPFQIRLAGKHNIENALAVIGVGIHLKIDESALKRGLAQFRGTKRRFEYLGKQNGALIYDDYAHHPAEIRATLSAFHELYPNRKKIIVFHPHTFTRTRTLFGDFAESFHLADRVFLLDIYGSAREKYGGVSSRDLVERMNQVVPGKAEYAPDRGALVEKLSQELTAADLLVTMGAGDVWQLAESLIKR